MGSIGRYMFRATMGAFLITLVSLTIVIWFTQAMRDFDLITSQRQTLLVFVGITGMIVPLLVMIIAPIALVDTWMMMFEDRHPLDLKTYFDAHLDLVLHGLLVKA